MKESETMQENVQPQTVFRDGLFKDKVVLLSGAGTGLGKAAAEQFARLGASLVICGRDGERLAAAADDLRKLGARVLARPMTIRDPQAVSDLMDEAWNEFGRIDVLVNNAGASSRARRWTSSPRAGWRSSTPTSTARGT